MEEKFNTIIFNNLQLLKDTEGHGIATNQFVNSNNKLIASPQKLILFLEREHLIEQELGVNNTYFLTEFGFNVLEGEQIYIPNVDQEELIEIVESCGETDNETVDLHSSQRSFVGNDRKTTMEVDSGFQLEKLGIYLFIGLVVLYASWKIMTMNDPQDTKLKMPTQQTLDSTKTQLDSH